MDVPSNLNVDSWESNANIIIPPVQVADDGSMKSSVDEVQASNTITTFEKNIVSERSDNCVEPGSGNHTAAVIPGYMPLTDTQLEQGLVANKYYSVGDIPLPPDIGVMSNPKMPEPDDHFTGLNNAVTSSDLVLAQDEVYIEGDEIPHDVSIEYISTDEPAVETAAQYQESAASVVEDTSRAIVEKNSHKTEIIIEEIGVMVTDKAVLETSIPIVDSVLFNEPDESPPTFETFPSLEGYTNDQTDSTSASLKINNGNAGNSLIDLVVVDAESVTMPDPVSLRPTKPIKRSVKDAPKEDSEPKPNVPIVSRNAVVQDSKNPPPDVKPIVQKPKTDAQKPKTDALKPKTEVQKPKTDPKAQSRTVNITSPFVSKDDLAKELQDRSKRIFPNVEPVADILFSKTMTKRLANNLVAGVSKVKEEMQLTAAAKKPPVVPAAIPSKTEAVRNSDDDELIAMLEGDVEDWTIDQPPPQLIEAARSPIALPIRNDPPKLDPAVEREMALKQLNAMPARLKRNPGPFMKAPRKTKLQVKQDYDNKLSTKIGGVAKLPIKRKVGSDEEQVKSSQQSNGESVAGDEGTASAQVVKAPRIFKTKKSLKLTNGSVPVGQAKKPASVVPVKASKTSNMNAKVSRNDVNSLPKSPDQSEKSVKLELDKEKETVSMNTPATVERTLVSPPRTYSSRIKKSTYSDDFVFPSTSKSRVVPIVGSSSNSKEAKPKATKATPAKAVPATKDAGSAEVEVPVKRPRGRPKGPAKPKGNADGTPKLAGTTTPDPVIVKIENDTTPKVAKSAKKPPPKRTEIDRLLQDEGAINMLYSVERDEEKRRTGSPVDTAPKRSIKSTRHSHKDLLMRTRLVKSAVQRLKNSPGDDAPNVSLRTKRATGTPVLRNESGATPQRKTSFDSNASLQSPPSLTPMEPSSPTQIFTYPPRLRPPAEASRIIRRHSSSSNFSSRSTSPNPSRRLSNDAMSPQSNNNVDIDDSVKETRKRGAPIYIRKSEVQKSKKKKRNADGSINTSVEDSIFKPRDSPLEDVPSMKAKLKREALAASRVKKTPSTDSSRSVGRPRKKGPDLRTCLAEAVTAFIAEDGNLDSSSLPPELPKETRSASPSSSFASISYASVLRTLESDAQRRADDAAKERSSPRGQSAALSHYKELSVRRHDNMVQVMISPVSTKLMNSLNPQVLRELRDVLTVLQKDDSCRAVLVTSTGSSFCLGVDFHSLIIEKADKRKAVAQEFALALRQFVVSLSQFNKPIIAGVHGAAIGLGVTMLPFFDMVFASDKATFYTPYARLGQAPEGAAAVTMPHLLGNAVTSELLYACRKLTATEALHYGLVTRILWPEKFQEELLPLIRTLANQSAQSMEATKALLRYNLRARVEAALEAESTLLVQHWTSAECQANFKRFLDDEDVGLQRQRVDA